MTYIYSNIYCSMISGILYPFAVAYWDIHICTQWIMIW